MQEGCKAQLTGQELGSSLWLRHLSWRAKGALSSRSMALGGGLGVCGWGWRMVLPSSGAAGEGPGIPAQVPSLRSSVRPGHVRVSDSRG